jgi:hypothetical protein
MELVSFLCGRVVDDLPKLDSARLVEITKCIPPDVPHVDPESGRKIIILIDLCLSCIGDSFVALRECFINHEPHYFTPKNAEMEKARLSVVNAVGRDHDMRRREFVGGPLELYGAAVLRGDGMTTGNSGKAAGNRLGVKALAFDVFGTVVDWRGSIVREGEEWGRAKGLQVDWGKFADR